MGYGALGPPDYRSCDVKRSPCKCIAGSDELPGNGDAAVETADQLLKPGYLRVCQTWASGRLALYRRDIGHQQIEIFLYMQQRRPRIRSLSTCPCQPDRRGCLV